MSTHRGLAACAVSAIRAFALIFKSCVVGADARLSSRHDVSQVVSIDVRFRGAAILLVKLVKIEPDDLSKKFTPELDAIKMDQVGLRVTSDASFLDDNA